MVEATFIVDRVHEVLPEARVYPTDLTGGGDHWHAVVVDPAFEGMRSFKRQRLVIEPFKPHIQTDVVHALDLVCLTPREYEERQAQQEGAAPQGHP